MNSRRVKLRNFRQSALQRKATSRKGENGRVVVLGGSREYVGAPCFAALGAVAAGVDLVYLCVPKLNFAASRKFSPNVLVREFSGNSNHLSADAIPAILKLANEPHTAVIVGPGLGRHPATMKAIQQLIKKITVPLVLDADAIRTTDPGGSPEQQKKSLNPQSRAKFQPPGSSAAIVLTPHHGEFRRLTGLEPTLPNLKAAAKKLHATILLKGPTDYIADPSGKVAKNTTGHPILTVGGTGDTLAGLTTGFLARGLSASAACLLAAKVIGQAGEKITKTRESLTPQILADEIPKILLRHLPTTRRVGVAR